MIGRILKGIGGFYTIRCEQTDYICKPRGKFRKDKLSPMVGDMVEFEPGQPGDEGSINAILPRKNQLIRPPVANLDLILTVMALHSPEPDVLLTDRLLVAAAKAEIEAIVIVNKTDLGNADALLEQYRRSGYEAHAVSTYEKQGLEELRPLLTGRIIGLAGQSAVGKSSLINILNEGADMEVGGVSRIERGRHTTRRAELLPLPGGGYLVDTPGFSLLELDTDDPETLKTYYPEFEPYEGTCRFLGCNHTGEPGCAVQQAAQEGKLSIERLERYRLLFAEQKEKWGRRYG